MLKVLLVAGARPNFMKIAPILREIDQHSSLINGVLVHTGQHYDRNMSESFFASLGIPKPQYNLEVGSGSHAVQTANIMVRFEEVCEKERPDVVLVVGDVNSTIAAGLVAKKLQIDLAHVEAGLRSSDRTMPEEINRLATDGISDFFFTTEKGGSENLLREGHSADRVHFVGHVMIDNLYYQLEKIDQFRPSGPVAELKSRCKGGYACLTLHRPSNVDAPETLEPLVQCLSDIATRIPILFPCHPRTLKNIDRFGLRKYFESATAAETCRTGIHLLDPLGYDDFLYLWKDSRLVLTDSGGLQEETTAMKIPCITLRENTERPVTVEVGSNELAGRDTERINALAAQAITGAWKPCGIPELWDGKASKRIVRVLLDK